ncbi:uncharacterized serine-rich protein C215.13-like [Herrania umbratica]|uniref:Uncharacterized serine-rich protein C215.13-like n=1 Tax=Herrania umbratica TaxID=108875 RepID=A0A6J1BG12_9ROSI|nr:uncharacterized serine-rich protein C215.13-like [Herrania umbratica]
MSLTTSRSKSHGSLLSTYHHPSPSIYSHHSSSSSSSAFASSSSSFASRSSTFFARATSPTRVNLYGRSSSPQSSPSVRFSINDRPISPGRSISFNKNNNAVSTGVHHQRSRTCLCSPTTHPGSFRCSLHKGLSLSRDHHHHQNSRQPTASSFHSSSALHFRRSAMKNSLVRIGGVEGELVKRALTALIRPSSHQQRRRAAFEPRPSRLSVMSKADDL